MWSAIASITRSSRTRRHAPQPSTPATSAHRPLGGDAPTLTSAQAATAARNWAEAAPLWQKVVETNPVNADYALNLATALFRARNYRGAIPAYEKALELGADFPSNMAYNI